MLLGIETLKVSKTGRLGFEDDLAKVDDDCLQLL